VCLLSRLKLGAWEELIAVLLELLWVGMGDGLGLVGDVVFGVWCDEECLLLLLLLLCEFFPFSSGV